MVLPELWCKAPEFTKESLKWTCGVAKLDQNGKVKFPTDHSAGVEIMLSTRAVSKLFDHGSVCERVVYVRL